MESTQHWQHTDRRRAPERHKHTMSKHRTCTTSRVNTEQWHWHAWWSERGNESERASERASERRASTFREAREYGGTLPSYFPEMIPQASGDHVMAPTPEDTIMWLSVYILTLSSRWQISLFMCLFFPDLCPLIKPFSNQTTQKQRKTALKRSQLVTVSECKSYWCWI